MNHYPPDLIVHNLPLVLLSGLEPNKSLDSTTRDRSQTYLGDGGFRLRADLAPLHHPLTESLRNILLSLDTSQAKWHSPPSDKPEANHAFKILSIGRSFTFPPRKAPPPPHSPRLRPTDRTSPPPLTLHSTLSPLSSSSPLYPDGIVTPLWITKHQHRLPSVLVSFYNLISDTTTSSLEDNKIKNEVNSIRNLISSTNYKTKFVIVMVADGNIIQSEAEERLANIRKGTNFDSKALYYLPYTSSVVELKDFARVLFTTLHPTCIEYYRDLSKHARRKRSRNSVPQPTVLPSHGASAVLSLQGWNIRYEFKLGVFAEFRQEMEAACRNYESAYEGLIGPEFLELIPASSSRFDDALMLADVIAIRIIRCFLWSSQAAAAVKWLTKHQDRVQDLLNRRGKPSAKRDWEGWLCEWSQIAAELIERSNVFAFALSQLPANSSLPVQLPVDRTVLIQEKSMPWENLHHEGYWLNNVRKCIQAQRLSASRSSMPDQQQQIERSLSNGRELQSSGDDLGLMLDEQHATLGMVNDENVDLLHKTIDDSISFFTQRQQIRMIEMLQFYLHNGTSTTKESSNALAGLRSLWRQSSWRRQGWWTLLHEVGTHLLRMAAKVDDHELCLLLLWELLAFANFSPHSTIKGPVSAAAVLTTAIPQISPIFAFGTDSGHVGEQVIAQLSLRLFGKEVPLSMHLVELKIMFDGGIGPVLITAVDEEDRSPISLNSIEDLDLREVTVSDGKAVKRLSLTGTGTSYWAGQADLSLGRIDRVYNFHLIPREAGPVSVASIVLFLSNGNQELTLTTIEFDGSNALWWENRGGRSIPRPFGMQRDVTNLTILPKPPKLEINLPNLVHPYYTNETVELSVEILNGEDETIIDAEIQVRFISPVRGDTIIQWKHDQSPATVTEGPVKEAIYTLPSITMTEVASKATQAFGLGISGLSESTDHELEITVIYATRSDGTTKLTKSTVIDLSVIRPFEASTTFSPRVYESEWDNFFAMTVPNTTAQPTGLKQQYLVKADVGSFARETLTLKSLRLAARRILGGALFSAGPGRMSVSKLPEKDKTQQEMSQIAPDAVKSFYFDLEIQKLTLGDRQPVAIDLELQITWSRIGSAEQNLSTLLIPKFLAPMAEPRVLLQASRFEQFPGLYILKYTLENPSMHFLTFSITMEGGEGLAFSGPKTKSVSLVPISRYEIQYRIYAQKTNDWANVQLQVLDAFFGQTLKIQPASEGVRVDKHGNVQIWLGS